MGDAMGIVNPFGERTRTRKYDAKTASKAGTRSSCRTCRWVLSLYPTLQGLDPEDHLLYAEHLKKVHGLVAEIRA